MVGANSVRPFRSPTQLRKNPILATPRNGLSRTPAPTPKFYCRKIASLFADFTLHKDTVKAVQRLFSDTALFISQPCYSSIAFLHRLVGLRLLRLCLKLRRGFAPRPPQWVSPLDPDQGRAPGPFARFARWVLLLCSGSQHFPQILSRIGPVASRYLLRRSCADDSSATVAALRA